MITGTLLVPIDAGASSYWTPWFPKGADNGAFTIEIVKKWLGSSGGSFAVEVWTKNREEAGSQGPGSATAFTQLGSTDFWEAKVTDLKQLVRLKITVTGGTGGSALQGVVYRFLPPTWYDKAV
jgi:hypothetical protein